MKKSLIIHPEELSIDWIDTVTCLGCNAIGIHPVGGVDADKSLKRLIHSFDDRSFLSLIDYARQKGLEIEYEMHLARYLMPKSYFDEHPEYFRMSKDGERVADYNFCFSNEHAMQIIENNALELAKTLYKSSEKFYFWMDDSKDAFCHCEKCRNLSPSDQLMIVLNRMIKKIHTQIPNAKMAYLAYYDTLNVPSVTAETGIFVEFAPYERNFKIPASEMNPDHIETLKKLIEFFGKEDAKILEYWYDNSLFSQYKKPPARLEPDNKMIMQDVNFYKSFKVDCISAFACYLGEDYKELYGKPDLSAFEDI